ncbi:GH17563 [Drosophila grimshawi]|uniref:GH17563 n=1 Tax=Drosophila grimshawi TaxID=7222 RepID=B4JXI9_DROGR|nr:GH17563 [Drosophila grimshawi]
MTASNSNASRLGFEQMRLLDFCGVRPMAQPLSEWFEELEVLYEAAGVEDHSVKVFHVMTILEEDVSDAKLELLKFPLVFATNPYDGHTPYERLKEQMLRVYQDMELKD